MQWCQESPIIIFLAAIGLKNAQSLLQASHALFLRYTDLLSQRRLTHESQQLFEENFKNVAKEVETTTAQTTIIVLVCNALVMIFYAPDKTFSSWLTLSIYTTTGIH